MYTYNMYIKTENILKPLNGSSGATEVDIMIGATTDADGKEGLVPVPISENKNKFLKGDGTWSDIDVAKKAEQDGRGSNIVDTYAKKSLYGDTFISIGRKFSSSVGNNSITCGTNAVASGSASCAIGSGVRATNDGSNAFGLSNISSNFCSFSFGRYNANMSNEGTFGKVDGTALAIGNGQLEDKRSNAFSVMFDGKVKAASTITAETTADYAEFFEWEDKNIYNEDRVGKFVTIHGDKISIATSNKNYILGIISGTPFVLGNGDCDVWTGMWLRDEFNRIIYEPAPKMELDEETGTMKEVFDGEGNLICEGERRKLNPNYDSSQKYISRFDRPEWSPVGMLGVLSVIQDGTCEVNGYCCCNENGIATSCDKGTVGSYRVIRKISDRVVRVVFR